MNKLHTLPPRVKIALLLGMLPIGVAVGAFGGAVHGIRDIWSEWQWAFRSIWTNEV
jgi:hypothetical protein